MDDKKGTWEKDAAKWIRQADKAEDKYTRFVDCVSQMIARHVQAGKSLDIGCGPGLLCHKLTNMGMDIYGTDLAENMIAAAVSRLSSSLPDAERRFRLCNDGDVPFTDMKFELITALQVFPYVEEYAPFIAKIKSLLRPGGFVVATNTNRRGLWTMHELLSRVFKIPPHLHTIMNLWRTGYHSGGHVNYRTASQVYSARRFDKLWEQAGFEVIDGLDYYHIRKLDRNAMSRMGWGRRFARHMAWQHAGMYRLPPAHRECGNNNGCGSTQRRVL